MSIEERPVIRSITDIDVTHKYFVGDELLYQESLPEDRYGLPPEESDHTRLNQKAIKRNIEQETETVDIINRARRVGVITTAIAATAASIATGSVGELFSKTPDVGLGVTAGASMLAIFGTMIEVGRRRDLRRDQPRIQKSLARITLLNSVLNQQKEIYPTEQEQVAV